MFDIKKVKFLVNQWLIFSLMIRRFSVAEGHHVKLQLHPDCSADFIVSLHDYKSFLYVYTFDSIAIRILVSRCLSDLQTLWS